MDTHGYPSLRINTHFTLTKVIVYNPKINVLDIGYTSSGTGYGHRKRQTLFSYAGIFSCEKAVSLTMKSL